MFLTITGRTGDSSRLCDISRQRGMRAAIIDSASALLEYAALLNLRDLVVASNEPLVKISDLNFTYDRRPILTGINMTIPRGKVVAIMGQSGCGKTTTLRLIGGQLRPVQGEVRFDGQVVHELDDGGLYAMRRRMGMLF